MFKCTPRPWNHVELVNEDGSSMTPEDAAEYSANTALHGSTGYYAVQATKADGKRYIVCFVGNGPDSVANGATIVTAVNYHDRLVEALKELVDVFPVTATEDEWSALKDAENLLTELEQQNGH